MKRLLSISTLDLQPLLFAFAICAGTITYFELSAEPSMRAILLLLSTACGLHYISRRYSRLQIVTTLTLILIGIGVGVLSGKVRTISVDSPTITEEMPPTMIEGWVQSVEPGQKGQRVRLRLHAIAGMNPSATPEYVRVTHRSRLAVSPGRFVRCWAVLRPPPPPILAGDYNFQRQAWFEKLGGVGYVQGRCRGGTLGPPQATLDSVSLRIASFRRQLALYVRAIAGERGGGFAAALVSGDRSFMHHEDQEALRGSGLAHLLAISGLHMGIVGGLVYLAFWRALACIEPLALRVPVQKLAAIAALSASTAYLILSGASVSTQRAFIMSAVVFGAVLFDRAAISLRSFAIAMAGVLLLQPESSLSPGFQMSFAASGALIVTYEVWNARRIQSPQRMGSVSYTFASLAVTSIVAALATAPFALYHFDRIAPFGLLANFLAMPVITFISAPSAAFSLITAPFGGEVIGLRVFGWSLEVVLAIAHWCSAIGGEGLYTGKAMPVSALAYCSGAIAIILITRSFWRIACAVPFLLTATYVWMSAPAVFAHFSLSGDLFVRDATGKIARYQITKGDGLAPLRYSHLADQTLCAEPTCALKTPYGDVVVIKDAMYDLPCSPGGHVSAYVTLTDSGQNIVRGEHCTPVLYWSHASTAQGRTLMVAKETITYADQSVCQKRPWRRCAVMR